VHKDQENSRKLVWIEAQNVAGWGCSNCTWVFHSANLPIPNSFRELTSHAQRQLDNEFASHTGAEHPRSEAAGSSGKAQRGVSDGTGREGCSFKRRPNAICNPQFDATGGFILRGSSSNTRQSSVTRIANFPESVSVLACSAMDCQSVVLICGTILVYSVSNVHYITFGLRIQCSPGTNYLLHRWPSRCNH
jgi:hypothetical protein